MWFFMSATPFFMLPKRFVKSTWSNERTKFLTSDEKNWGYRIYPIKFNDRILGPMLNCNANRFVEYLSVGDFFVEPNLVIGCERSLAGHHFVDQDAKSPPINCFVVTLQKASNNERLTTSVTTTNRSLPWNEWFQVLNILVFQLSYMFSCRQFFWRIRNRLSNGQPVG